MLDDFDLHEFISEDQSSQSISVPNSISVYRYRTFETFDSSKIIQYIAASKLRKGEFGIIRELAKLDGNIRTLWAKLGDRGHVFVDTSGKIHYARLRRFIVSTGVVEFFDDEGETGLFVYGGGNYVQRNLIPILENQFGFSVEQQQLELQDIRSIFLRYEKKGVIKRIQIDPSKDVDWGNVGDNKMTSPRGQYLNFDASILKRIREDEEILIYGFKALENDIYIPGMRNKTKAWFELKSSSVSINITNFALEANALQFAETIFYDLVRQIYRSVVRNQKWIKKTEQRQLRLALEFDDEDGNELDSAAR